MGQEPWIGNFKYGTRPGDAGFHRNPQDGTAGFNQDNTTFTGILYRADSRPPHSSWFLDSGIFSEGFDVQKAGITIHGRETSAAPEINTNLGTTRGVISTSTSLASAAYWAASPEQPIGWIYCIYVEKHVAFDIANQFEVGHRSAIAAAEAQNEIAFTQKIDPGYIFAARKVKFEGQLGAQKRRWDGSVVLNSKFTGGAIPLSDGASTDFRAFSSANSGDCVPT